MSQDNIEVVRRVYEFANELDPRAATTRAEVDDSPFWELWEPDVVIEELEEIPDQAAYRGYEGLLRWWAALFSVYDKIKMEPRDFIPVGDRVVVAVDHRLRSKAGVELEYHGAHVWTVRRERVIHVIGYRDVDEALEAVGYKPD
jgi:ketosteroid isomerase-like protein